MHRFRYFGNCVGWKRNEIEDLIQMQDDAKPVTIQTFRNNVHLQDLNNLALDLGYAAHVMKGLLLSQDYMVGYFKSKYKGKRVYFLQHSAIEYVFSTDDLFNL